RLAELLQGRKVLGQRYRLHFALQGKFDVVRVQQAKTAEFLLQGKRLSLELDSILGRDVGPHVHFGGGLEVRMAELEYDFRIADRKAVFIGDASAKDERTVVEREVLGIEKHHLPDSRPEPFESTA